MRSDSTRREFFKLSATAAGAACLGSLSGCQLFRKGSSGASHLVRFGNTDLFVSRLCQGTAFRKSPRRADNPLALAILRHAIDIGVNFFDTAEAYGWDGSEMALGNAIVGRRDQVVITTKAAPYMKPKTENAEAEKVVFTRDVLFAKAEGSLRRLRTDYIDIYLLHQEDDVTPAEELADSMDALVKSGKIRYWGVSNHSPQMVSQMVELGKRSGKAPISGLEDNYTLIGKERRVMMEKEMFPLIDSGKLGLMAFGPLGRGRLVPGYDVPEGSPLKKVRDALDLVAGGLGATIPQVCIAWALTRPQVTSALTGAEKPEHVSDNFGGTQLELRADAVALLDAAADAYDKEEA